MSDTSLNDFDSQTREQALKSISEAGEFPRAQHFIKFTCPYLLFLQLQRFFSEYICGGSEEGGIGSCRNRGL